MIKLILLVAIAWLLWLIREELVQMGERQRNLKAMLERLSERVDRLAAAARPSDPPEPK
ncbi:MAG: hypothetical protein CALGDGBN_02576 [Pseudomonadales bacterium]|nr:hypothetical protein [Pseudomonadales bacterium]